MARNGSRVHNRINAISNKRRSAWQPEKGGHRGSKIEEEGRKEWYSTDERHLSSR
jgi:hypothetical protein